MSKPTEFPWTIDILYEDEACLVVNKPAGLLVHPDGHHQGPCLTDWIVAHYPETATVGESQRTPEGETLLRPGIVHRLDRDTSGALLIAKTASAHEFLKQQFQDKTINKKYLAFVWGELKEEFGTITRPIGRSGSDFRRWSAQRGTRGDLRPAETYWTRLWTGQVELGAGQTEKLSLIQAEPRTGRTHQIRVHFLAVHHPVLGDGLYAPKRPLVLGFERMALHAWQIAFESPIGQKVPVTAPLPPDFAGAIKELGIKLPTVKS